MKKTKEFLVQFLVNLVLYVFFGWLSVLLFGMGEKYGFGELLLMGTVFSVAMTLTDRLLLKRKK